MDEQNLNPEKWPNLNTFATSDKTFVFFIQHIFLALTIIEDSLISSCETGGFYDKISDHKSGSPFHLLLEVSLISHLRSLGVTMGNVGHCLDLYVDQHIVFQMILKLDSGVMLKLCTKSFKVLQSVIQIYH